MHIMYNCTSMIVSVASLIMLCEVMRREIVNLSVYDKHLFILWKSLQRSDPSVVSEF